LASAPRIFKNWERTEIQPRQNPTPTFIVILHLQSLTINRYGASLRAYGDQRWLCATQIHRQKVAETQ